jgi:hypothetical protein
MSSILDLIKEFVATKDKDTLSRILSYRSDFVNDSLWHRCLNDVEALQILLQEDSLDPTYDDSRLLSAVMSPDTLKLILEDGRIDPSINDSQCLIDAVEWRDDDLLKLLLEDGRADPTVHESECLRIAAQHDSDCLRLILEDGRADPGAKNSLCVGIAAEHNPESFILLLEDGRAVEAIQHRQESSCQILADTNET